MDRNAIAQLMIGRTNKQAASYIVGIQPAIDAATGASPTVEEIFSQMDRAAELTLGRTIAMMALGIFDAQIEAEPPAFFKEALERPRLQKLTAPPVERSY